MTRNEFYTRKKQWEMEHFGEYNRNIRPEDLQHASGTYGKGFIKKLPNYYPDGRDRYFYSQDAYDAYLRNQMPTVKVLNATDKSLGGITNKAANQNKVSNANRNNQFNNFRNNEDSVKSFSNGMVEYGLNQVKKSGAGYQALESAQNAGSQIEAQMRANSQVNQENLEKQRRANWEAKQKQFRAMQEGQAGYDPDRERYEKLRAENERKDYEAKQKRYRDIQAQQANHDPEKERYEKLAAENYQSPREREHLKNLRQAMKETEMRANAKKELESKNADIQKSQESYNKSNKQALENEKKWAPIQQGMKASDQIEAEKAKSEAESKKNLEKRRKELEDYKRETENKIYKQSHAVESTIAKFFDGGDATIDSNNPLYAAIDKAMKRKDSSYENLQDYLSPGWFGKRKKANYEIVRQVLTQLREGALKEVDDITLGNIQAYKTKDKLTNTMKKIFE